MRGISKENSIRRARLKFVKVALLQNETLATKNSKMADFWSPAHHKLIRSLLQKGTQEDSICNIASSVDGFGPIAPRSPMLIKHRPGHLNKGPIFPFNNSVLRGNIRRRVLVFKTKITAKVVETRVLEFYAIVTANRSHGMLRQLVLQPQDQISNKTESFILGLHEKDPRIARKVINHNKNIPLPTCRTHPSWTNCVHMQKLSGVVGHHLIHRWVRSSNH